MNNRVVPISPSASVDPRAIRSRAGARIPVAYAAKSPYTAVAVTGYLLTPSATVRGDVGIGYQASAHDQSLGDRFERLVKQWRSDTRDVSSVSDIILHPAYQQIIGLGAAAVPLILRELAQHRDHWFWALTSITGENPIPNEHAGRMEEMTRIWLQWGHEHGYH